jgi:hypothetical protein
MLLEVLRKTTQISFVAFSLRKEQQTLYNLLHLWLKVLCKQCVFRVPWALSLGVKRPECEADHSPPSSAEVKE